MTPLMKPPGWRFNRRNRQSRMARQEGQVPGRVAGASNQRSVTVRRNYGDFSTQLQCKRCQIAAVSHSRDGYSVIAKSLIPNSYSAYYPRTASISGGPCGNRGGSAAYMPLDAGGGAGLAPHTGLSFILWLSCPSHNKSLRFALDWLLDPRRAER